MSNALGGDALAMATQTLRVYGPTAQGVGFRVRVLGFGFRV